MQDNYEKLFCSKLTDFRTQKNLSARKMSLDLGFSDSYINKIENGKTLPGMEAFFQICYYLNVEPKSFFDTATYYPILVETAIKDFTRLTLEQQKRMLAIMEDTIKVSKK